MTLFSGHTRVPNLSSIFQTDLDAAGQNIVLMDCHYMDVKPSENLIKRGSSPQNLPTMPKYGSALPGLTHWSHDSNAVEPRLKPVEK